MASLPIWLTNIKNLLMVAWLMRFVLIVYGHWHDGIMNVKFTDIDYHVFSDAAGHVSAGLPPYRRPTYRYTPLLAWLLVPNHVIHPSFGKLLFITLDVVSAWIMYMILSLRDQSNRINIVSCMFWLFNPLTAIVSSRGNAESTMSLLMLLSLYYILTDRVITSAVLYGIAVHVKIYPIVHCIALYLAVDRTPWERVQATGKFVIHWRILFSKRRVLFTIVSAVTFLILTVLFYIMYGWEFLHETYFYHVTRTDVKHNFSVYFYALYLTQKTWLAPLVSSIAFLPQLILMPMSSLYLFHDLPFCCFIQTFLFVTFNKVCTSQVSLILVTSSIFRLV